MEKDTLEKVVQLRKNLHQEPELSGKETKTAEKILSFFEPLKPDRTIAKLGGNGVVFHFKGDEAGPKTLFRAELDGLPIPEKGKSSHKSKFEGLSHTCGHDGHMAIIAGLGLYLSKNRPRKGEVVLLFQPAEETGEGAEKVLADKKFKELEFDYAFALHNLPGYDKNQIILKKGTFAAASKGMVVELTGNTSHAAHPEDGNSPAEAMSKMIVALQKLPDAMKHFSLITVVHAVLGEITFGTTPGKATIRATLRAFDNEVMEKLQDYAEKLMISIAKDYGLTIQVGYTEEFAATINDPEAWNFANEAAKKLKLKTKHIRIPFRWSEDFGQFSKVTKTLLFGIGSGKKHPQLHDGNYDFPDDILPTGLNLFTQIIEEIHQ
ncbi:amidohydrolase [Pararhodonellum marinum]|uniref:amidohydrolase n=1 Tax=Pararhodonellum marinum TaxID=2755358 RepID=UPI00188E4169|nr:amidohydrolase [Pararhodonellum marinum]